MLSNPTSPGLYYQSPPHLRVLFASVLGVERMIEKIAVANSTIPEIRFMHSSLFSLDKTGQGKKKSSEPVLMQPYWEN
jgi:hypothetical protein